MTSEKARQTVDEIFSLYEKYGREDYIGEPVSQLEHMVQAAQLAETDVNDDEVILAAFFHDIGHLTEFHSATNTMDGMGVKDHEKIGADYLAEKGFSEKICRLVQSHVQTKRYLTYKYFDYYQQLSAASKITLSHQGGIMSEGEAEIFEEDPLHILYIRLREWDDKAKIINQSIPALDKYGRWR